ncbi:hypothetical protein ACMDCR_13030 [Labrys okinawensis]|uniref:hypothetical protein n=1 Tax=Labrys okinawensis TaxID=346911 RepID=UPI0039BD4F30
MPHPRFIATVAAATVLATSAASAMPVPAPDSTATALQVIPAQYAPCPPGYKVTSHGGCKLSHYLRKHPYQQQYYYDPQPRYDYQQPRYDYQPPRYRQYYDDDQGNDYQEY